MQVSVNKKRVPILVIAGTILIILLALAIANVIQRDDGDTNQRLILYIPLIMGCAYFTALSFADYWKKLFDARAIFSIEEG